MANQQRFPSALSPIAGPDAPTPIWTEFFRWVYTTLADAATGLLATVTALSASVVAHIAATTTAHGGIIADTDVRLADARTPTAHAGTHVTGGGDTIADVVAGGNAGLMTGADKTKLDGIAAGALAVGYCLQGAASTHDCVDSETRYWGGRPSGIPGLVGAIRRIYICRAGTIKSARVYAHADTAGTNENWSMYIRLNDTTDALIQTLGSNSADRVWANDALAIVVAVGDYIEIKETQPAWATNPLDVTRNATIYVE